MTTFETTNPASRREVGEVLEDVALPGTEPAADQHSAGRLTAGRDADGVEELAEAVLDGDLLRAEDGDRVAVGHPARSASSARRRRQRRRAPVHAAPSRTSDEYGLSRLRSRTSSWMRSFKRLIGVDPAVPGRR